MTIDIEDLVRTAQERQAGRAVPAERIRAALPQRAAVMHRHRQFRMLGAAVAAAVVVVVTVPVVALRGGSVPPTVVADAPSGPPSPSSGMTPVTGTRGVAMFLIRYGPAWVPAGYRESIRQADIDVTGESSGQTLMRVWKKQIGLGDPWGGAAITLTVRTEVADPAGTVNTSGQKVDINGTDGWLSPSRGDGKSALAWVADGHTILTLSTSEVEVGKADLLRMARSVRSEKTFTSVPVRLGWLPDGLAGSAATISGPDSADWRTELSLVHSDAGPGASRGSVPGNATSAATVSVLVGSVAEAPDGGEELTVRGRPARTLAGAGGLIYLVVDVAPGRFMTLAGNGITLADLARIAEQAEILGIGIAAKGPDWLDH
uniref:hypothetical protein n=1 Tax=Actinoplanes sp. NPDC020271 TaxID=3363896 RepID=UPI0037AEE337